ncbi:MAG TPA: VWA domain-containing protein, partial [Roseiflexaceae bacterium]|nr:VWA domain-containing protein [Roseiflexaceae bacterium]
MTNLSLQIAPAELRVQPLPEAQIGYLRLDVTVSGPAETRAVNWALLADASRSMRIPIVDEAQFRALIQQGGAQETLVDGVPVWQLNTPAPAELRAAAPSALDHVARALHTVVERLDAQDRFALLGCAEEALLLNRSTPGDARAELVGGIERLK